MILKRKAVVRRKTKEVDITVLVDLDERGYKIDTGIPFFDHMLESFARHSGVKLVIEAKGDIEVDEHHTVEDVAIALGSAIKKALGDKRGIARFGDAIVPMDDAVAVCGVDIGGRGFLNFEGEIGDVKGLKFENFVHFFDTLCRNSGINAYQSVKGFNAHHIMEASFKAFGIAFGKASRVIDKEFRSTKGVLD
jgi:imidazoleglycerol-phosphate dehydratase